MSDMPVPTRRRHFKTTAEVIRTLCSIAQVSITTAILLRVFEVV